MIEELLNIKKQKAIEILNEMQKNNLIIKKGTGKNIMYKLKQN